MLHIPKNYWNSIWCRIDALALETTPGNFSYSQEDGAHGRNPCKGFWLYKWNLKTGDD
jgi:hypothetical protein